MRAFAHSAPRTQLLFGSPSALASKRIPAAPPDAARRLCAAHAAATLLEEAACCGAAGGREPTEGLCLGARVRFRLRGESGGAASEELARFLGLELVEALGLDGAAPELAQIEVTGINIDAASTTALVQLDLLRAFGRPSPYELFLRLRALAVDTEGPMYGKQYKHLSTMKSNPELTFSLVTGETEQIEMTANVAKVAAERWTLGPASSCSIVARPQQTLLPAAIVVSLRCVNPPSMLDGAEVHAKVVACPAGARDTNMPPAPKDIRPPKKGQAKSAAPKRRQSQTSESRTASKKPVLPETTGVVRLRPCPGSTLACVAGELVIFGLKPGQAYDVFVSAMATSPDAPSGDPEVAATAKLLMRTSLGPTLGMFGAEPGCAVRMQTEEPDVARRACILEMLGLDGAPCAIDPTSCAVAMKVEGDGNLAVVKEHGIRVLLEAADNRMDNPGLAGGMQLPVPTIMAKPTHLQGRAEVMLTASAEVVKQCCPQHTQAGWWPPALSVNGNATRARAYKAPLSGSRCKDCKWHRVSEMHKVTVVIALDIVHMAEIGDWRSVQKRAEISKPEDLRLVVATMLNTRPLLSTDLIMGVFERSTGRSPKVDFSVRPLDGASALHVAVEENHFEAVKSLLNRKIDPAVANEAGETPLHAAARGGMGTSREVAELLLGAARSSWRGDKCHAADLAVAKQSLLDQRDGSGRTALHLAAMADQLPLVRYLLEVLADASIFDNNGCGPLHAAVAAGSGRCASALIATRSAAVNEVTSLKSRSYSPLHLACERCEVDVATMLLHSAADAQMSAVVDGSEKHALVLLMEGACRRARFSNGVVDLAKLLISKGQPPRKAVERAGESLLAAAFWSQGDADVMGATELLLSMLVQQGLQRGNALGVALVDLVDLATSKASEDDRRNQSRVAHAQTPGTACMQLPDIVAFALQLGAEPNATASSHPRDTALHLLMRYLGRCRALPNDQVSGSAVARTVRLLLQQKASPRARNAAGQTPAMLARSLLDNGEQYGHAWLDLVEPSNGTSRHRQASKAGGAVTAERAVLRPVQSESLRATSPNQSSRESPRESPRGGGGGGGGVRLPGLSSSPAASPRPLETHARDTATSPRTGKKLQHRRDVAPQATQATKLPSLRP